MTHNTTSFGVRIPNVTQRKLTKLADSLGTTKSQITAVLLAALVAPPLKGSDPAKAIAAITSALGLAPNADSATIREALEALLNIGGPDDDGPDGGEGAPEIAQPDPALMSESAIAAYSARVHSEFQERFAASKATAKKPKAPPTTLTEAEQSDVKAAGINLSEWSANRAAARARKRR